MVDDKASEGALKRAGAQCDAMTQSAPAAGAGREGSVLHAVLPPDVTVQRSEEHTSELQSLMRISYAVFCLKKKKKKTPNRIHTQTHTDTSKNNNYTTMNDKLHYKNILIT